MRDCSIKAINETLSPQCMRGTTKKINFILLQPLKNVIDVSVVGRASPAHGPRKSLYPKVLEFLPALNSCCPHSISLSSFKAHEGKVNDWREGIHKKREDI